MLRITVLLVVLISSTGIKAQGLIDGFFQGKGKGVVAVSASYETASTYWAGKNEIDFDRNMIHAGLFGSYGLLDGLDVIASVPFVDLSPQDASLFLKGKAFDIAIGAGSKFTLGAAAGFSAPITNYNTESSNAIGQRATVVDGRVFMQYHINRTLFIQAQAGYGLAGDPVPSFIPASVKIGYTADNWYADLWFDYRDAETGKDYLGRGDRRPDNFRQLEVDYKRVGGTFYKPVSEKVGLSLGASYTLSGRNSFQSTIVSFAYVRSL